ncbi:hypothetical protein [Halorarius litoreus]|uniref:hypothetical protein n=1 Tax=Halorarius litoreus TaxID=2962676 RepID=UPI0020CC2062|nr:hypothetical protein [Halorarius litoreus]
MSRADRRHGTTTSLVEPVTLRRLGLVVALCGLPLLLVGLGTAYSYLCCQSHPVPAAVAFSLKIEYTVAGATLLLVGLGLLVVPPLSSK